MSTDQIIELAKDAAFSHGLLPTDEDCPPARVAYDVIREIREMMADEGDEYLRTPDVSALSGHEWEVFEASYEAALRELTDGSPSEDAKAPAAAQNINKS